MDVQYLVLLLCIFWNGCNAIMWSMAPNTQKCFKEEMYANVSVAGEYEATEAAGQRIDFIVKDSKGHILDQKDGITKGKFQFVTETYDIIEVCFISKVPQEYRGVAQDVTLNIKVEAKNHEGEDPAIHSYMARPTTSSTPQPIATRSQQQREDPAIHSYMARPTTSSTPQPIATRSQQQREDPAIHSYMARPTTSSTPQPIATRSQQQRRATA